MMEIVEVGSYEQQPNSCGFLPPTSEEERATKERRRERLSHCIPSAPPLGIRQNESWTLILLHFKSNSHFLV